MRPARTMTSGVQRMHRVGERQVDGHRHHAQRGAGQHHRDLGAARQLGQELGVAGMPEARILQRLLLDRIGGEAGDLAGLCHLRGAFDRASVAGGIGRIGLAGPGRHLELHGAARAAPSRRPPPPRAGLAISRTGTARPSVPARAASRAGSSIAKNGRAASRASHALRLSSPPTPAGSPIVTASGSGVGHGCLMSMVATRRISRM